jgi:hypothetical protein
VPTGLSYSLTVHRLIELLQISWALTPENIGDAMERALGTYESMPDSIIRFEADALVQRIRNYARDATHGWRCFSNPVVVASPLKTEAIIQLIGLEASLRDLNYCFERIQEAALLTFENSTPVRFYVNGILHYVTALFLLGLEDNKKAGYSRPGSAIRVLSPLGLANLLDPVYAVLDRPFGKKFSYGETIRRNRNSQFVHGSYSIDDVRDLVSDSDIFNQGQRDKFVRFHLDLNDRLIILRLRIVSLLTSQEIDPEDFTPEELYGLPKAP